MQSRLSQVWPAGKVAAAQSRAVGLYGYELPGPSFLAGPLAGWGAEHPGIPDFCHTWPGEHFRHNSTRFETLPNFTASVLASKAGKSESRLCLPAPPPR